MAILRRSIADFDIGGDGVLAPLLASCAVALACAGSAEATKPVAGQTTLTYQTAAGVGATKPLAGQVALICQSLAGIGVSKPLAGQAWAAYQSVVGVDVAKPLAGQTTLTYQTAAGVGATKPLAGQFGIAVSSAATVGVAKLMSASASAAFTQSAFITATKNLYGTGNFYIHYTVDYNKSTSGGLAIGGQSIAEGAILGGYDAFIGLSKTVPCGGAGFISAASHPATPTISLSRGQANVSITCSSTETVVKPLASSAALASLLGSAGANVHKTLGAHALLGVEGLVGTSVAKPLSGLSLCRFNHLSLKLRVMPVSGFGYSARVIYVGGEQRLVRVPQDRYSVVVEA